MPPTFATMSPAHCASFSGQGCACAVCACEGEGKHNEFFPFHFSGIFLCSLFSPPSLASCCNYKVVVVVAAVVIVVVAAAAAMRF